MRARASLGGQRSAQSGWDENGRLTKSFDLSFLCLENTAPAKRSLISFPRRQRNQPRGAMTPQPTDGPQPSRCKQNRRSVLRPNHCGELHGSQGIKKKTNYEPLPSFQRLHVQRAGASEPRGNSKTGPAATESCHRAADKAGLQPAVNRFCTCMPSKQIHYQHASTFQQFCEGPSFRLNHPPSVKDQSCSRWGPYHFLGVRNL